MIQKRKKRQRSTRTILHLPDLDHSKSSVLQSLGSAASKRTYGAAIEDFITWYCSEPGLAFGRTVVLSYRYELEARRLSPATINLRLAAVSRLAYEASDNGLLNPDLAAGIRRVKGAKRLGFRLGNWLTAEQSKELLAVRGTDSLRDKRDYAILSLLLGCGLRRAELTSLTLAHLQQRDGHWAIVNLYGKGGHVRTVPVPTWVKESLDRWIRVASISEGPIFRRVNRTGKVWGPKISEKLVWSDCPAKRPERRDRTACTARFAQDVCQAVPCGRRRTRADPVSAWPPVCRNHRTLPRFTTADRICRERPDRH